MFVQPVKIKTSYSSPANFMDAYGFFFFLVVLFVLVEHLMVTVGRLNGITVSSPLVAM